MDYAIIETGGKQYRVAPGDAITVEKLGYAEGASVELDRVLLLASGENIQVGSPTVEGAKVVAEVVKQGRADKLTVFKYKSKVRYQVKQGHRQSVTRLSIKEIITGATAPKRRRQASGA